jgi:hypothetical protein
MPTQKQIEANRRNARLSTGPRTPEGKAAVRYNAYKHGLTARELLLPEESNKQFLALSNAFRSSFRPQSPPEEDLLFQLAAAAWRLDRIARIETSLPLIRFGEMFCQFRRHETRIRRSFYQALDALKLAQARPAPQYEN